MRSRRKRLIKKRRVSLGVYLVEVLVALGLGALLSYFLLDSLSNTMRFTTSTQSEIFANAILSELQEWTRGTSYEALQSFPAESELLVNRTSSNEPGSNTGIKENALLIDEFNETWSEKALKNKFSGKVTYSVQQLTPDSLLITTKVTWFDGTWTKGRSILSSTIVKQLGAGAYLQ